MARWIRENPNPAPAIECPFATGDDPLEKLIPSLPGRQPRDEYVVQVFKCDKDGWPKNRDPYYERV